MIRVLSQWIRLGMADFSEGLSLRRKILLTAGALLIAAGFAFQISLTFDTKAFLAAGIFVGGLLLFNGVIALELAEKKTYEGEMGIAAHIQRGLLPGRLPGGEGFSFSWQHVPARAVGGDYFDVVDLGAGRYGVVIADASGKGVPAALLVSCIHSQVHIMADAALKPSRLLERINRNLCGDTGPAEFVTLFYGIFDSVRGTICYSNAGHEPVLLIPADGPIRHLDAGGTPLGALPNRTYEEETVALEEGESLVFYTDGITEARNRSGDMFDMGRLVKILEVNRSADSESLVHTIDAWVSAFRGKAEQEDDSTLLVLSTKQ